MWGATNAPAGWLSCDGSSVSRTTYASLFATIGTTYGSVDGNTFNLPNLVARFPLGATNGLGTTGGYENVTLTTNQIPAHTHTEPYLVKADSTLTHESTTYFAAGGANNTGGGNINSSSSGGGLSHSNMPPYVTVNYIIKYADVLATSLQTVVPLDGSIPMTGGLTVPFLKVMDGTNSVSMFFGTHTNGTKGMYYNEGTNTFWLLFQ